MIKVSEVAKEVRRLADTFPNFQYKAPCKYLEEKDGEKVGSCIVGQALVNLGLDKDELSKYEGESAYAVLNETCEVDSMNQLEWVDTVQDHQDYGRVWGEAIKAADYEIGTG